MARKPSPQTLRVLEALATEPAAWRHGYELGAEVGLQAGSLYPILMRLHERGLLDAEWEDEQPPGRPRRHHYRLSATGVSYLGDWAPARGSSRATVGPAPAPAPAPAQSARRTASHHSAGAPRGAW